jgi:hypothetical protein
VLRARGVRVLIGTSVVEATADGVRLSDGQFVATRSLIWCVGVRPDPLVEHLGLRRPALAVIVVAITVIAVLGMRYADQHLPGHLDRNHDALVRGQLGRDEPVTRALANLGNPIQVALLIAAVAGAAATTSDLILKPLIGRLRYG